MGAARPRSAWASHSTQLRSAQRRRRGWPRPVKPDHDEPLVGPTNPQIPGGGGDLERGRHYYAETGLLGAAALLAVLAMAVGAIARSSAVLLGLCALGSWLVGVVVTTSYFPLSPVWLFLGVVLSWDRLFPRAASMRGR